jgi:hypothetical protein
MDYARKLKSALEIILPKVLWIAFCLFVFSYLYRLFVYVSLKSVTNTEGFFSYSIRDTQLLNFIACLSNDFSFTFKVICFALVFCFIFSFSASNRDQNIKNKLSQIQLAILGFLLMAIGFFYCLAYKSLSVMGLPVTYKMLMGLRDGFSFVEFLNYIDAKDYAYLIISICIIPVSYLFTKKWPIVIFSLSLLLLTIPLYATRVVKKEKNKDQKNPGFEYYNGDPDRFNWLSDDMTTIKSNIPDEIATNPFSYAYQGFPDSTSESLSLLQSAEKLPSELQQKSIALVDPLFSFNFPSKKTTATNQKSQEWNILFFLIESAGAKYALNTNKETMPFLTQLTEKSLFLSNHYSSSVSTITAVFSIFSGIYPSNQFSYIRKGVNIPTLFSYLGDH